MINVTEHEGEYVVKVDSKLLILTSGKAEILADRLYNKLYDAPTYQELDMKYHAALAKIDELESYLEMMEDNKKDRF